MVDAGLVEVELDGRVDEASRIRWLASEFSKRLREPSRVRERVQRVIVVYGDFPQRVAGGTVTYVHERNPGALPSTSWTDRSLHIRSN